MGSAIKVLENSAFNPRLIGYLSFLSLPPAISGFVILPKDTSGKDLGLSGQCLRDRLLAVDSYGAVVLFVHDRLNWTVAVQLKIITFRGKEINNAACGLFFFFFFPLPERTRINGRY